MSPKAAREEQTRWLRVKEIFSEASEAKPEERDLIVDTRCGTDKEMADEVRSLPRLGEEDGLSHVPQYPYGAASASFLPDGTNWPAPQDPTPDRSPATCSRAPRGLRSHPRSD